MTWQNIAHEPNLNIIADKSLHSLIKNDGWSYRLSPHGTKPSGGLMVSIPGHEETPDIQEVLGSPHRLQHYMTDHMHALTRPGSYFGGWYDKQDKKQPVYLDTTTNTNDLVDAVSKGKQWNQQAVYDIKREKGIYIADLPHPSEWHNHPEDLLRIARVDDNGNLNLHPDNLHPEEHGIDRSSLVRLRSRPSDSAWKSEVPSNPDFKNLRQAKTSRFVRFHLPMDSIAACNELQSIHEQYGQGQ